MNFSPGPAPKPGGKLAGLIKRKPAAAAGVAAGAGVVLYALAKRRAAGSQTAKTSSPGTTTVKAPVVYPGYYQGNPGSSNWLANEVESLRELLLGQQREINQLERKRKPKPKPKPKPKRKTSTDRHWQLWGAKPPTIGGAMTAAEVTGQDTTAKPTGTGGRKPTRPRRK